MVDWGRNSVGIGDCIVEQLGNQETGMKDIFCMQWISLLLLLCLVAIDSLAIWNQGWAAKSIHYNDDR